MKKKSVIIGGLLCVVVLLVFMPLSSRALEKVVVGETVTWTITDSRVVAQGETAMTGKGELTQNYIVEANATSADAPISDGLFITTVSLFKPKEKMAGQEPGVWYLKAKWEIIDRKVVEDKKKLKEKHNEYVMKGFLTADLPFNPVTEGGTFDARSELPLTLIGKYWGKASGTFYTNELFEGSMEVTFDRWQKVK